MFTSIYGSSVFPHVTRAPTEGFSTQICFFSRPVCVGFSGLRRKFPRGTKFRHNRVTSQINIRGSAEGKTILGGSGGMPQGKFCKTTPKNTHFCAYWKQVLDITVFCIFLFLGSEGVAMAQWPPPPYASVLTPVKWFKFLKFKSNPIIIFQNIMQTRNPNIV